MGLLRLVREPHVNDMIDDRELAVRARGGNEEAFADLVARHQGGLRRYVARMLSDSEEARDVAQLAFIRAWENLEKYDPKWSFSTWLYRIASNLTIDLIRARDSRQRTHVAHLRMVSDAVPATALAELGDGEVTRIFAELAERLTPAQRSAFLLREVEGLSTAEVAGAMGCSEATVRNHVFQARVALRDAVAERYPEYLPKGGGA